MKKHELSKPISILNKKFSLATNEFNKLNDLHYGCLSEDNENIKEDEESEESPSEDQIDPVMVRNNMTDFDIDIIKTRANKNLPNSKKKRE